MFLANDYYLNWKRTELSMGFSIPVIFESYQGDSHQEQFKVQYLVQRRLFDMQTRGVGDQITDPLINGQPTLP